MAHIKRGIDGFSVIKDGKAVIKFESYQVASNICDSLNGNGHNTEYTECDEVANVINEWQR